MNAKGALLQFLIHQGFPALASLLCIPFLLRRWPAAIPRNRWPLLAVLVWIVSRVLYGWFLYVFLGYQSQGDFQYWLQRHAARVEDGLVPGRDFENRYGPLFPYLQAGGHLLLGHPVGVLLPFFLGEAAVVWLSWRVARRLFAEDEARALSTLVLLNPLLWHQLVRNSQDEALFVAFLLLALEAFAARRPVLAGLVLAVGACATKATLFVYGGALLLFASSDRGEFLRAAGAALLGTCAIAGPFAAAGARPFSFHLDAHLDEVLHRGCSLTDALSRALAWGKSEYLPSLAVATAALGAFLAGARMRLRAFPPGARAVLGLAACHAGFILLMPTALPGYFIQGVPFWILGLALTLPEQPLRTIALAASVAFSFLAVTLLGPWMDVGVVVFHLGIAAAVLARGRPTAVVPAGEGNP